MHQNIVKMKNTRGNKEPREDKKRVKAGYDRGAIRNKKREA